MGFCLLNNVAMAAEYLIQHEGATRLAIIDLDLHHGNGTQDIFYERRDVLYCSIHQAPLYPGTGMLADIGEGEGRGTTVNIPLPPGSGDLAYEQVTSLIFLPILQRYQPEMILISFGFDPHWLDPLGHMMITADGYARIIHNLAVWADSHCNGRVGLYLEGGYDLDAGAACSQAVIQALLGKKWKDLIGPPHHPQGKSWRTVLQQAMDIWNLYDVE
jgi:acetoin utilization deacetylase AcuC-like enzyme